MTKLFISHTIFYIFQLLRLYYYKPLWCLKYRSLSQHNPMPAHRSVHSEDAVTADPFSHTTWRQNQKGSTQKCIFSVILTLKYYSSFTYFQIPFLQR